MLKLLLLEYITAGGLNREPLATALLQEGAMMQDALLRDFDDITDIELITTYDVRLSKPKNAAQAVAIDADCDPEAIWQALLNNCDAALIVAPETGGILSRLTHMIEASNKHNLGSHAMAVDIASDKYATYQALETTNILTIPTYTAEALSELPYSKNGYILKPKDGAGCEQTYFCQTQAQLEKLLADRWVLDFIIQPFQPGKAASISALFKAGQAWVLSCNEQQIDISEQQVALKGCTVNALAKYQTHFHILANEIAQAIPTLHGYVGIDVVIAEDEIFVVEINPRITTSYIGLRESLNYNPASLILDLATQPIFVMPNNLNNHIVKIALHA